MDSTGIPTPRMDWDSSNLPDAWRKFRQHVELMFSGPLASKKEEERCSYLLLWVGEKGRDVFNTWTLTADERKLLTTYYDRFETYVTPKANPIFARYKFHEKIQGNSESFDQFLTELRLLVKDCGYPNGDEMVRDRIVFGINSPRIREKLLCYGSGLTLENAIDIARSHELSQQQLKTMVFLTANQASQSVHAVNRWTNKAAHTRHGRKVAGGADDDGAVRSKECGACGQAHSRTEDCPAKGRQCNKCKKFNHFAKVCRARTQQKQTTFKSKKVHTVSDCTEESPPELFIDSITKLHANTAREQAFAEIEVGKARHKLKFKVDTGAQANVIPANTFHRMFGDVVLGSPDSYISGYGGQRLKVKGACRLTCRHKEKTIMLDFDIVDVENAPAVLGMRACLDLNIVKLVHIIQAQPETHTSITEEFADMFKGIGLFPGECVLQLKPAVTPVVCPPRRIPYALRGRLKDELDKMEKMDIITKVTEPTEWVNALVAVEKPKTGKLRVCLDPRPLNKAIQRPHYPLPTLDDITPRLAGAQYFSVLDARSGYWTIKLSHESSMLTTFNTVFGRYRFKRLPFGIISAQDEFQWRVDEAYEGLQGIAAIVDDILVYGRTKEEHDTNLCAMLERTRERGIKLNEDKSVICVTEVSYFGHRLTPARFAPRLSETTAPLRQLLKESSEFVWDSNHDIAFQQVKDLLTQEPGPVLTYFDPTKDVKLQVDASKCGLGAVLLQEEKPVGYASKALNETEGNYAQIEKELYAVLFGCKRFHQYLYGRQVVVESDHKPLESIMRKPLAVAPPRLQRMILQLQRYDIVITHKPGKQIPVADTLSRKPIECNENSLSEGMDLQIHSVGSNAPISDNKLAEIKAATAREEQLSMLRRVITSGWPESRKKCPPAIAAYWNHRDEISETNGILLKGEKIIVPHSLRAEMLSRIHTGHLGIEKCKQRARDVLFWPGMGKEIEALVGSCSICQERRNSAQKEPMISHPIPERPWQVIATDLFTWNNNDYIVAVDYYSRYFEVEKITSLTSKTVIQKLRAMFARFGIPQTLISDNGPCYSSREFKDFACTWDFEHITSSPLYPQSNGLAERTVQTAKALMDKAHAQQSDPYLSLLEYRNTPVDGLKSPAQLLMSRRLRSILPSTEKQLQPGLVCRSMVRSRREVCQTRQKLCYDKTAKAQPALPTGAAVRVQLPNGKWEPATVVDSAGTQRSYNILTEEGQVLRRNRRHLLKTESSTNTETSAHDPDHENTESVTLQQDTVSPAPQEPPRFTTTKSGCIVKPRAKLDL
ncbi:hypothetical protein MHYP_G00204900 [Metynnis hypsauchen]